MALAVKYKENYMEIDLKKAVAYIRVSSREQSEEGYSLEAQEQLINEYSERKNTQKASGWPQNKSILPGSRLCIQVEKDST